MILPSSGVFFVIVAFLVYVSSVKIDFREVCDLKSLTCTVSDCNDEIVVFDSTKKDYPFTEVVFKRCRLPSIPPFLFSAVPKLKRILMYKCALRSFDQITFSNASSLRALFLPNNRLTELPEKLFANLSLIEEIRLPNNHISHIHPKAFVGLKKLRHLDLTNNKIIELASEVFANLTALEYIDLSYNDIETFDAKIFAKNSELKTILLNNNNFVIFESDSLAYMPHLTLLDISNTAIESIELSSVDTLRAQNSQLQHCSIIGGVIRARVSGNQLKSISIGDKAAVKEIDVHNNLFETLSDFDGMMNLQKLDVSKNAIRCLNNTNTSLLLDLPSLQYLNVAYGKLQNLDLENFVLLGKLTHLDLAYNNLQVLDARVFESLLGLEKIYLEGNRMRLFDYETFLRNQVNVREMGIFGNEWPSPLLKKMSDALKANDIKLVARLNPNEAGELLSHQTTSHPHHTIHAKTLDYESVHAATHPPVKNRDAVVVVTLFIVLVILVLQLLRIFKEENYFPLLRQGIRRNVPSTRLNEEESGPL